LHFSYVWYMSCPSIVLDMITPIINGQQYKLQTSSLCNSFIHLFYIPINQTDIGLVMS
jgi:hypothetical protein